MSREVAQAPACPQAEVGRRPARRRRRFQWEPYALIAPAAIFMLVFFVWPAIQALLIAFQTPSGVFTLANFQAMVHDTDFRFALTNTLLLLALIIPIETTVALLMAVLAQTRLRGSGFFLYFWSLPLAVSDLAAGLVWLSIFTSHGFLNSALQDLHLIRHPVGFLDYNSLGTVVAALVIAEVWRSISIVMVVIMSGIQSIPEELNEAASLMGATGWQRFTKVTLPLLKPSIQVALILRTTAAFQVFAMVLALAGAAYPVLAIKTEQWVYDYQNYQLAGSYAALILLLSALGTIAYLILLRSPRQVFQR
jgi:multiple sugar transport system permease protein